MSFSLISFIPSGYHAHMAMDSSLFYGGSTLPSSSKGKAVSSSLKESLSELSKKIDGLQPIALVQVAEIPEYVKVEGGRFTGEPLTATVHPELLKNELAASYLIKREAYHTLHNDAFVRHAIVGVSAASATLAQNVLARGNPLKRFVLTTAAAEAGYTLLNRLQDEWAEAFAIHHAKDEELEAVAEFYRRAKETPDTWTWMRSLLSTSMSLSRRLAQVENAIRIRGEN